MDVKTNNCIIKKNKTAEMWPCFFYKNPLTKNGTIAKIIVLIQKYSINRFSLVKENLIFPIKI